MDYAALGAASKVAATLVSYPFQVGSHPFNSHGLLRFECSESNWNASVWHNGLPFFPFSPGSTGSIAGIGSSNTIHSIELTSSSHIIGFNDCKMKGEFCIILCKSLLNASFTGINWKFLSSLQQRPNVDGIPRYIDSWHVVKETAR